jgi:hypothetical protein
MMVPDAVILYRVFGLTLSALFALARVIATSAVIYLIVSTPFKRRYHWAFLALNAAYLWLAFWSLAAQLTTYSASEALFYYDFLQPTQTAPTAVLLFQFVVLFTSSKIRTWQKYVLIAGYAWAAATVWAPIALGDMSFLQTTPHFVRMGRWPRDGYALSGPPWH